MSKQTSRFSAARGKERVMEDIQVRKTGNCSCREEETT